MSKSKEAKRTHKPLTKIIPVESCTDKDIRLVKPSECKMWERHNRVYADLTEKNCRHLISAMLEQGRQEFAAVVRLSNDPNYEFEVICGARRHWAVSYLIRNGHPDFLFQIDVRQLNDEKAFMLGHIENNERKDISDYERAEDFLYALDNYYKTQKEMASALGEKEAWLSRYLDLGRLPTEIVSAFSSPHHILPGHAKILKPFLKNAESKKELFAQAKKIVNAGSSLAAADVVKELLSNQGSFTECTLTTNSNLPESVLVKLMQNKITLHIGTNMECKDEVDVAKCINGFFNKKIVN